MQPIRSHCTSCLRNETEHLGRLKSPVVFEAGLRRRFAAVASGRKLPKEFCGSEYLGIVLIEVVDRLSWISQEPDGTARLLDESREAQNHGCAVPREVLYLVD